MDYLLIKVIFPLLLLLSALNSGAQQTFALYDSSIPNAKECADLEYTRANNEVDSLTFNVSVPTLTVYRPGAEYKAGTSVIICPGGGYHVLLTKREGSDIARAFAAFGVTAFVLKYRLPSERTMIDKSIGSLQDAQQAIKIVRENANKWDLDPGKIGIMGFSAGGHVASSLGTHFERALVANDGGTSLRPDFMLLVNPVISFNAEIGHSGSRDNLLGKSPDKSTRDFFSNELQVTAATPVTWLTHSSADKVVAVANSITFYNALARNGISAELHLYAKGEHGFLTAPTFDEWFGRCIYWMKSNRLITPG